MAEEGKTASKRLMEASIPTMLIGIVVIMIMPIPAAFLDILLAFSITLSLVVLFTALYIEKPIEFSSYPALLLMLTLFRLAMNVSSTRLILMNGDQGLDAAGNVIQSFGEFVLGGNFVIGVVVFIIIVMVNFSVITKGSGRIAEVAARFTLDAMPGKQMAIDSDLNSGLINEDEAKEKRKELSQESEFYGAMDGASKFVKGDAMAGIVITFVNILGGLFIGVVLKDMEWLEAAETFTLLTVGDGLVSNIPALIVSTSAGIIVARAGSSGEDLGTEVTGQLTRYARPLFFASGIATFFALVPGLPFLPFMLLGGLTGFLGLTANAVATQEVEEKKEKERTEAVPAGPAPGSTEEALSLLNVDLLELEVGYELVPLVDVSSGGDLIERIRSLRRQFAQDLGFVVPAIHIRDNVRLEPSSYRLMLKGIEIARGEVKPHHFLAMDPGGVDANIPGIPTKEPAFGLDALWIAETDKERAQLSGYTVVDPATVITTHLTEVIKGQAHEILGRQEVQSLLDNMTKVAPKLVEEVVPTVLSLGVVQQVLSGLLREGVSIRDLRTVLETLADWGPTIKSPERLAEQVRRKLARAITSQYMGDDGTLTLTSMSPVVERVLHDSLQVTEQGSYFGLEPSVAQLLLGKLKVAAERFAQAGKTPVLLVAAPLRPAMFSFCEKFIPGYVVLSHQEITPSTRVQSLGVVDIEEQRQPMAQNA